jgi:hypothetical protein
VLGAGLFVCVCVGGVCLCGLFVDVSVCVALVSACGVRRMIRQTQFKATARGQTKLAKKGPAL